MKVPLMVAFYKQAETDPGVLSRQVTYTKALDDTVGQIPFQAKSMLEIGKSYSIEQLLEYMIVKSDNGAKNALLASIDIGSFSEIYTDLGIQTPGSEGTNYLISAKSYSLFFRILYNSTYLSDFMSERALTLLNQTEYNQGITAGVPQGVKTAEKFGQHIFSNSEGQETGIELHNCGIVYHPGHPYVICVMTRGDNLLNLTDTIKNISSLVYQSVDSDYKK